MVVFRNLLHICGWDRDISLVWITSELPMKPKVMRKLQGKITAAFRGKEFITDINLRMSGSCIKYLGLVIKEMLKLYAAATILVPSEFREHQGLRDQQVCAANQDEGDHKLLGHHVGPLVLGRR